MGIHFYKRKNMSRYFPLCQLAPSFLLLLLLLPPKISSSSDCSDDPRYVAKCPGWSRVCSLLPAFMDVFCPRTCNTCSKCACEDQATFAVRCNACECSEGFIEGSACKCGIEKPHQRIVGGVESQ